MAEAAPGQLMPALQRRRIDHRIVDIKAAFEPDRCGRIKRRAFCVKDGPVYTREEMSWFVNEDTGMYTAIDGTVYDITGVSFLFGPRWEFC